MRETIAPKPPRLAASPAETEESLVHPIVRGPLALLFAWTLPTLALCFVAGQALYIAWSEMSASNRGWAYASIAALGVNLAMSAGMSVWLQRAGKRLTALYALGPLAFLLAHIGFSAATIELWLPANIEDWMVSPDRLLLLHWSFLAIPTCLLATILSGFRSPLDYDGKSRVSVAAILGVPIVMYVLLLMFVAASNGAGGAASAIAVSGFALCAVALGSALFRLLLLGWKGVFGASARREFFATTIVALVAPLGGLWLNAAIPFPVDFQHPGVYALVLLTAASLLLPLRQASRWNLGVWTFRCLTLPFSVYFFFVFLPYLALAAPAMLAFGAGFLLFAPTFLLIFHLQKLWRAYHSADRSPATYAMLGLAAAMAIPGYIWFEARLMRAELHRGMDFALAPDVEEAQSYPGIPYLTEKSLEWLHAFKHGEHYPILSPLRMQSIFDGQTLPDRKLEAVYRTFTDGDLPRVETTSFFGTRARGLPSLREAPTPPPLPPAELVRLSTSELAGSPERPRGTRIAIEMRGGEVGQSEFKGRVALPPGSWVTGFALYIGDERVEGRLFEKKTALWVYRMIRDDNRAVRLRDPATLTLEADGALRLQVFPFDPGQIRRAEVDVASVEGGEGRIESGERVERFAVARAVEKSSEPLRFSGPSGVAISLDADALQGFADTVREPYLEIFLDRSRSGLDGDEIARFVEQAHAEYPETKYVQVTLANLEAKALFSQPLEWRAAKDALRTMDLEGAFPKRRGLLLAPAMQRAALAAASAPFAEKRYPIWVVGLGPDKPFDGSALEPYAFLHPESPAVRIYRGLVSENGKAKLEATLVQLARVGSEVRAFRSASGARWLRFSMAAAEAPLELFDAEQGAWRAVPTVYPRSEGAPFLRSIVEADLVSARASLNPAFAERRRPSIVAESKRLNVLSPLVAFTVVENDAQWKMLESKERENLGVHGALEFDETPEPGFWVLLGGLAVFLAYKSRGARARPRPALP